MFLNKKQERMPLFISLQYFIKYVKFQYSKSKYFPIHTNDLELRYIILNIDMVSTQIFEILSYMLKVIIWFQITHNDYNS